MTDEAIGMIAFFIFLFAIPVFTIFLQIHLSKKDNKLAGLVLPTITFAISLMAIIGMAVYIQPGTVSMTELIDGEWVTTILSDAGNMEAIPGAIGGVIYIFVIMNIPTIILLVIYRAVKNKKNRRRDVEKMSVQDL